MSLHPDLRAIDRTRAMQAMTAWMCNDEDALDAVLTETDADPDPHAATALLLGVLAYADWITTHTGPVVDDGVNR